MFGLLKKIFGSAQDRTLKKYFKIAAAVNEWDEKFKLLSDEDLKQKTTLFKERIAQGESLDDLLPEAYATVKNVCRRLVGSEINISGYSQKWDMIPFDVQIVGAIAMHHGCIAEMHTGEGKTLTAIMPLYLNALSKNPVHLVTVNDYLAHRDCQWVGIILKWLGLSIGSLMSDLSPQEKKAIYNCDIVYGTASEFGFDYLRDNSMTFSKEEQVQRGFYFAIIDEADSILIDEARTPLIISGPVPNSRQMYDELKAGVDELVRKQKDFCNQIALEAKKVFDNPNFFLEKKGKEQQELESQAFRKLWLVGKGTPQNKILKKLKENPDIRSGIDKWDLYYYAEPNKEEKHEALAELFIIIDEKANEFELTDKGIYTWSHAEESLGQENDFTMFDIGYEFGQIDLDDSLNSQEKIEKRIAIQKQDADRKERAHNLRQLLRAHLLMEKDIDYIIHEDKIVIIDENTGRPQPGRRFSDGLHQAIEAKERVSIQKETQTYATITLQNFFRMYKKLAGMTGTAGTEANELKQIYKLEVLEIPTHRKSQRTDFNDEIYMSEREKYNAILKEVREVHEKGQPLLIGTESVEVSEKLARIFKLNKLDHTVLNAKQPEKEAEIIANAGKKGSITISTNMAGRGTDIKLEAGVAALGGLYVMGTTRHQSRRIDRQLRGRCGRQGDPGTAKFYISFEDSLLRLFASPRLTSILQRFRPPEGEPISASMLNKSIETAQKRIENRNYTIRKHTLEYDDVMNKQRQEIYAFRNEILQSSQINQITLDLLEAVCNQAVDQFFISRSSDNGWDAEGFRKWLMSHFSLSFPVGFFDQDLLEKQEIAQIATDKVIAAFKDKITQEEAKALPLIEKGFRLPPNPTNEALRHLMLRKLDHFWQEHLLAMDHLRVDVNLRTVGNRDPLTEFKHEAFLLFDQLGEHLRKDIAQNLFKFELIVPLPQEIQMIMGQMQLEKDRSLVAELEMPREINIENSEDKKLEPIVIGAKTGRNEDCPCGSGKKYKKCCGLERNEE